MKAISKRIRIHLLAVAAGLTFLSGSGCASIVRQGDYTVHVNGGGEGATCTVSKKDSGEVIFQGQPPCTVILPPGSDDFTFKVGESEKEISHKLNPWTLGNILLFGPFFGLGIIIDTGTGYAYEYSIHGPLSFPDTTGLGRITSSRDN